jgi:hypothetical protein
MTVSWLQQILLLSNIMLASLASYWSLLLLSNALKVSGIPFALQGPTFCQDLDGSGEFSWWYLYTSHFLHFLVLFDLFCAFPTSPFPPPITLFNPCSAPTPFHHAFPYNFAFFSLLERIFSFFGCFFTLLSTSNPSIHSTHHSTQSHYSLTHFSPTISHFSLFGHIFFIFWVVFHPFKHLQSLHSLHP